MKNMYQTLKRDQDRISSLAHDNEQLQAKVKELQKDLAAAEADKTAPASGRFPTMPRRAIPAGFSRRVGGVRLAISRCDVALASVPRRRPFSGPESDSFVDPYWPLSSKG